MIHQDPNPLSDNFNFIVSTDTGYPLHSIDRLNARLDVVETLEFTSNFKTLRAFVIALLLAGEKSVDEQLKNKQVIDETNLTDTWIESLGQVLESYVVWNSAKWYNEILNFLGVFGTVVRGHRPKINQKGNIRATDVLIGLPHKIIYYETGVTLTQSQQFRVLASELEKAGSWKNKIIAVDIDQEARRHLLTSDGLENLPSPVTFKPPPEPCKIDQLDHVGTLPVDARNIVFGRDDYTAWLSEVWQNEASDIAVLWGEGGVGKTTLVEAWLNDLQRDGRVSRTCRHSFNSDADYGSEASGFASLGTKLERWLSISIDYQRDPEAIASQIANSLSVMGGVLVLDGIEVIQRTDFDDDTNPSVYIFDPIVRRLLEQICRLGLPEQNNSRLFIVITSWHELSSLRTVSSTPVMLTRAVTGVSEQASIRILKEYHLKGESKHWANVVEWSNGHPMSLHWIAATLEVYFEGSISRWTEFRDSTDSMGATQRTTIILLKIERLLSDSPTSLAIIRLLVSSRRTQSYAYLRLLISKSDEFGKLAEDLDSQPDTQVRKSLHFLAGLRLVVWDSDQRCFELHSLVRNHFTTYSKNFDPSGWRSLHQFLFNHLRNDESASWINRTDALRCIDATWHAIQSELREEGAHYYLESRNENSANDGRTRDFGLFGEEVHLLREFFPYRKWALTPPGLSESARFQLLYRLGINLRWLGLMDECCELMDHILTNLACPNKFDSHWTIARRFRAECLSVTGRLESAKTVALSCVDSALRSPDSKLFPLDYSTALSILGSVNFFLNRQSEALENFSASFKAMEKEDPCVLPGFRIFRYFEFVWDLWDEAAAASIKSRLNRFKHGRSDDDHMGLRTIEIALLGVVESLMESRHQELATHLGVLESAGRREYYVRGLILASMDSMRKEEFDQSLTFARTALDFSEKNEMYRLSVDARYMQVFAGFLKNGRFEEETHLKLLQSARSMGYERIINKLNALTK